MFARLLKWLCDRVQGTQNAPCHCCGSDLLTQAKEQLVAGYYIGAIASSRCHVAIQLLKACRELKLFTRGRQEKRPNLASMAWRLMEAGAIDRDSHNHFVVFGQSTAGALDGGSGGGATRAWKAISQANHLCQELNKQLRNFRQDDLLSGKPKNEPSQPDTSANL